MTKAKRDSTHKQYATYLDAWFKHCQTRALNPTQAPVHEGLEFLQALRMSRSLGYSATNTARSALSSVLKCPDGQQFGQHPFVKLFMKGVFNDNPPVPRYSDTWDPDTVLSFLRHWSPASALDLKYLTLKLTVLILLVSAQRVQTLFHLDLSLLVRSSSSFTFSIGTLLKQSRPGFSNPTIRLKAYAPDRRLCVFTYLREYLQRTETLRKNENALLLTYRPPHKKASKDTIARWVKIVLTMAGIDSCKYTAHSIRAASVSAAKRGGATVHDILTNAGWSSTSTFAKYYDKTIVTTTPFDVAVLGN